MNKPRTPGEVCKVCWRDIVIGFQVPDDVWMSVVGNDGTVLCVMCFDERAHEKRIPYEFTGLFPCPWQLWEELPDE